MLVLFETSVGYAIFKVGGRLSRWRGKAGVGQERRRKDVRRGRRCSGSRGCLLCPPAVKERGKALGLGGAYFGEHVAAPFGALGSVRGFGPFREVDRSRIRILQVMIRSMGFVLRVLRNDWKVLTED